MIGKNENLSKEPVHSMLLVSSKKSTSLALAASLLTGAALAGPTISDWSIKTEGANEIIEMDWDEPGKVELNQFQSARQVVVVFPEAELSDSISRHVNSAMSELVKKAKLQDVTLPNGNHGVQLTLTLDQWTTMKTDRSPDSFRVFLNLPERYQEAAQLRKESMSSGIVLSDQSFNDADLGIYGGATAPSTGAGQGNNDGSAAFTEYYVPEAVEPGTTGGGSMALSDLSGVESKLNEYVRRVDFQGTPLENVLRLIAEQAELNIMVSPGDVAGRTVTLRLRNVTLRQILDAILKQSNLGYTIEEGGIVRILPRNQVRTTERETVTEAIPINWVSASAIAETLDPLVGEDEGMLEVMSASNMIIVRDVPESVQQIRELIYLLDVPEKQVLIEMRLVNMSETARREFGVRTGYESEATESRFLRDPGANFFDLNNFTNSETLTTQGFSETGNSSTTFVNELEQLFLGQSTEESELVRNLANTLTNTLTGTTTSESAAVPSSRVLAGALAPGATALQYSGLFTANIFGAEYNVDLAINAQEDRGEAVTLANPIVLSLNNQEAIVEIKRQIPYISAINTSQGSIGTVEFVDVGTEVTLLPRITNNGYVMMEIEPEQVIDTGDRPNGVPVTDERRVKSSVIVRDEETVALGGLRQFEANSSESGVPYLLRLPVLSWLFKNQGNEQIKTELYLFVTPSIVKDPTLDSHKKALYEKIDYNWDLPDYFFDEVMPRKAPGEDEDPRIKY